MVYHAPCLDNFGRNREGSIHSLSELSNLYQFELDEIEAEVLDDINVSSTKIRNALLEGKVKIAAEWLNHPFMISGEVVYGQQLGRELGYPTANIQVKERHKLIPPIGIYAVQVVHNDQQYPLLQEIDIFLWSYCNRMDF